MDNVEPTRTGAMDRLVRVDTTLGRAMRRRRSFLEGWIERVLFFCAFFSVLGVMFITIFIFMEGLPLFKDVGVFEFLLGTTWLPTDRSGAQFGILPFIVGSFYVTFLALVLGVPLSLACAVYLAEIAKDRSARILRRVIELLAGIPSVVYGFFGVVVICPAVRTVFGGTGFSVLSAAIILAIMILPTIINISEVTIRSVPKGYKEGSLALGATHWQSITRVILPNAFSGILAAIVLGTGRAIGETMAVLMVAGNAPIMPDFRPKALFGLTSKVRTLTMNIVTDMGYAADEHLTALFTTSIVLFIIIMVLNISISVITKKIREELEGQSDGK